MIMCVLDAVCRVCFSSFFHLPTPSPPFRFTRSLSFASSLYRSTLNRYFFVVMVFFKLFFAFSLRSCIETVFVYGYASAFLHSDNTICTHITWKCLLCSFKLCAMHFFSAIVVSMYCRFNTAASSFAFSFSIVFRLFTVSVMTHTEQRTHIHTHILNHLISASWCVNTEYEWWRALLVRLLHFRFTASSLLILAWATHIHEPFLLTKQKYTPFTSIYGYAYTFTLHIVILCTIPILISGSFSMTISRLYDPHGAHTNVKNHDSFLLLKTLLCCVTFGIYWAEICENCQWRHMRRIMAPLAGEIR